MIDEADPESETMTSATANANRRLPTTPCSVVWSKGHAYVLEMGLVRSRWVGCDDRGRPLELTNAELQSRGWTLTRAS